MTPGTWNWISWPSKRLSSPQSSLTKIRHGNPPSASPHIVEIIYQLPVPYQSCRPTYVYAGVLQTGRGMRKRRQLTDWVAMPSYVQRCRDDNACPGAEDIPRRFAPRLLAGRRVRSPPARAWAGSRGGHGSRRGLLPRRRGPPLPSLPRTRPGARRRAWGPWPDTRVSVRRTVGARVTSAKYTLRTSVRPLLRATARRTELRPSLLSENEQTMLERWTRPAASVQTPARVRALCRLTYWSSGGRPPGLGQSGMKDLYSAPSRICRSNPARTDDVPVGRNAPSDLPERGCRFFDAVRRRTEQVCAALRA
ncbi:hypothetical protein RKD37_008531 [Streptomyces ambofaciens]